jgi:ATP-binding cassette subfamily G (WHITE) protein 2
MQAQSSTYSSTSPRSRVATSAFSSPRSKPGSRSEPLLARLDTLGVEEYAQARQQQHDRELLAKDLSQVEPDPRLHTPIATLSFKDVGFSVKVTNQLGKPVSKTILSPCSGHYEPGRLVAIMGPSGSGKTTLLDILAGKKTSPFTGAVFLNGRQVLGPDAPRDRDFARVTAYVPQHDVMPGHWRVEEAIMFNQALRIPKPAKVTWEQMKGRVGTYAKDLGLDTVLNTPIGSEAVRGISGGQRRRVTLARGLVTGANILFCDEPTSGLSSTDAEICIRLMRFSCLKYATSMFVVIHQPKPELASLFDDLLLLTAEPGRVIYSGPMANAQAHYHRAGFPVPAGCNPLDFFLDMVTPSLPSHKSDELALYYTQTCAADARLADASIVQPCQPHPHVTMLVVPCGGAGNFLRNNDLALRTIVYTMQRWSQLDQVSTEAVFFRHEGYFGAVGAFLQTIDPQFVRDLDFESAFESSSQSSRA